MYFADDVQQRLRTHIRKVSSSLSVLLCPFSGKKPLFSLAGVAREILSGNFSANKEKKSCSSIRGRRRGGHALWPLLEELFWETFSFPRQWKDVSALPNPSDDFRGRNSDFGPAERPMDKRDFDFIDISCKGLWTTAGSHEVRHKK